MGNIASCVMPPSTASAGDSASSVSMLDDYLRSAPQFDIPFTAEAGAPRARMHPSCLPAAAERRRPSLDGLPTGDAPANANAPVIAWCYSVGEDGREPDRQGMDYLAYFLRKKTGSPDWLVVPDEDAQPEGYGKTHNQLCQLMLALKGMGHEEGLAYLKRYDSVASTPLPAAPLPAMNRFELAEEIRGYLREYTGIVLQLGEKAMVISAIGIGERFGRGWLTVQDPATRSCVAVFDRELAGAIPRLCPPAPVSGLRAGPDVGPVYRDCMVSYLPNGSYVNRGYETE
ncbi:hypothetical protein [Bordetella genomosp. 10]|nr:hypothetical protein [Bordetella genomosp. 10]